MSSKLDLFQAILPESEVSWIRVRLGGTTDERPRTGNTVLAIVEKSDHAIRVHALANILTN